jgi:hypothetical protein
MTSRNSVIPTGATRLFLVHRSLVRRVAEWRDPDLIEASALSMEQRFSRAAQKEIP